MLVICTAHEHLFKQICIYHLCCSFSVVLGKPSLQSLQKHCPVRPDTQSSSAIKRKDVHMTVTIMLTIGSSASSRLPVAGRGPLSVRGHTTCQHLVWRRTRIQQWTRTILGWKAELLFLIVQLLSRPEQAAKALRKGKKRPWKVFVLFVKKKYILFFLNTTKISSKHTDPTVSLLNYIERVQPLTVSGAHQS